MKSTFLTILILILIPFTIQGCSVGMALSGKEQRDTSTFYKGADRSLVHAKTGAPDSSFQDNGGKWVDTYLIVTGNEPSAGRALGHGAMDVLTLGIWEIVGTPIEAVAGKEDHQSFIIYYDDDNKIERVEHQFHKPNTQDNKTENNQDIL